MDMLLWLCCFPGGVGVVCFIAGAGLVFAWHKGWIGDGKKKGPKWTCGFCESENEGDAKECSDCGVAKAESLKERRRKALAEARKRAAEIEAEADVDGVRTPAEQRRIDAAQAEEAALEGCPACGETNAPEMKFCGSCGAPLRPAPPSPRP